MKVESFKRFSLETLCCGARAFPVGTATRLVGHFKIYSAHMRMWSTWLRPFCSHLGETFFVSTGVRVLELLAVSMPPSKVCPQCTAAVPVKDGRQVNTVIMSSEQNEKHVCV